MNYYIVKPMKNLHQPSYEEGGIDRSFQAFEANQYYQIPHRTIRQLRSSELTEFVDIMFSPFPLFSETAKKALDLFCWNETYREFIFADRKSCKTHLYYLPFFPRIKGYEHDGVNLYVDHLPSEDMPAVYMMLHDELWMILRLDLIESLMRRGLSGVTLIPTSLHRKEGLGNGR